MRIVSSEVSRAAIDAQVVSATYPGHVPARWALPLLDALDTHGAGWRLVELDEDDLGSLWLPAHAGEACHGDSLQLGDDADGGSLRAAGDWLARNAGRYAAANPSCWGRITHAAAAAGPAAGTRAGPAVGPATGPSAGTVAGAEAGAGTLSPIVVSADSVGDRVKPAHAALVVVDGLHRALGYWMAGHRRCRAYMPLPPSGPGGEEEA